MIAPRLPPRDCEWHPRGRHRAASLSKPHTSSAASLSNHRCCPGPRTVGPAAIRPAKAQSTPLRPQLVAPALPVCGTPLNLCVSTIAPWKGERHEQDRIQAPGRNSGGRHRTCTHWSRRRGRHKEADSNGYGKIARCECALAWARSRQTRLGTAGETPPGAPQRHRIGKPRARRSASQPRSYRDDRCAMIPSLPFCPIEQARVSNEHV